MVVLVFRMTSNNSGSYCNRKSRNISMCPAIHPHIKGPPILNSHNSALMQIRFHIRIIMKVLVIHVTIVMKSSKSTFITKYRKCFVFLFLYPTPTSKIHFGFQNHFYRSCEVVLLIYGNLKT